MKNQKALFLVAVADLPSGEGQVTLLEACSEGTPGTPPKSCTSGTAWVGVSKGIGVFLEGLFIWFVCNAPHLCSQLSTQNVPLFI